jgi:hypothetical protein
VGPDVQSVAIADAAGVGVAVLARATQFGDSMASMPPPTVQPGLVVELVIENGPDRQSAFGFETEIDIAYRKFHGKYRKISDSGSWSALIAREGCFGDI